MIKGITRRVCITILGIILLINCLTIIFTALDVRKNLNWFSGALLSVETGSMEPEFSVGDMLVLWETPYEELEPGDIITFHHGDELVTHQIVRLEGGRIVTKGLANTIEDTPIGRDEYCAKLIVVIPGAGVVLDVLTSPISLLLVILLILVIFYGMPILHLCYGILERQRVSLRRPGLLRIMTSLALISMLGITPFITAAKYKANINASTAVSADATYFSSNFLSESGDNYYIKGWNGVAYGMTLEVRNYNNNLLYNMDDHDLVYGLRVYKFTHDDNEQYEDDYEVVIKPLSDIKTPENAASFSYPGTWPAGVNYGPYQLSGDDRWRIADRFGIDITVDGDPIAAGKKIRFGIMACTSVNNAFYKELLGDFTLEAATSQSFLGETELNTQEGTALVTYSLQTNLVGGSTYRDIKVSWKNTKLYLNEYEPTAMNIIMIQSENYCRDDGTGHGYIILPLQAYSSVKLQFFKYNADDSVKATGNDPDITAAEVTEELFIP